jgi:hypothetical protein
MSRKPYAETVGIHSLRARAIARGAPSDSEGIPRARRRVQWPAPEAQPPTAAHRARRRKGAALAHRGEQATEGRTAGAAAKPARGTSVASTRRSDPAAASTADIDKSATVE